MSNEIEGLRMTICFLCNERKFNEFLEIIVKEKNNGSRGLLLITGISAIILTGKGMRTVRGEILLYLRFKEFVIVTAIIFIYSK